MNEEPEGWTGLSILGTISIGAMVAFLIFLGLRDSERLPDNMNSTGTLTCFYQLDYEIYQNPAQRDTQLIDERNNSIRVVGRNIQGWNRSYYSIENPVAYGDQALYFRSNCDEPTVENVINHFINDNGYERFLTVELTPSDQETYLANSKK